MRKSLKSLVKSATNSTGAAAIEFAVAAIPVLFLLFGGITYGGVLATLLTMRHAASEGARASIAGVTLCERQTRAENTAHDALLFSSVAGAAVINVDTTANKVEVGISLDYANNPITPVLFPVPETLTARAVAYTDGVELPGSSC
jgi:Flp pilus assembly protein TadG